jgi:protein involved in polysaccharide export with SLBB domain
VDERGEITLPRLGRIRVIDHSADVLQESLRKEFSAFLRNPSVEVVVLRRIGVHGEVRRPQLYMVDLTMTVRDVIALAGGVLETGNPNRVTIVRGGEEIRLDREEIASFATAELRSGDQVVVGRRNWFALNPIAAITTAATVGPLLVGLVARLVR